MHITVLVCQGAPLLIHTLQVLNRKLVLHQLLVASRLATARSLVGSTSIRSTPVKQVPRGVVAGELGRWEVAAAAVAPGCGLALTAGAQVQRSAGVRTGLSIRTSLATTQGGLRAGATARRSRPLPQSRCRTRTASSPCSTTTSGTTRTSSSTSSVTGSMATSSNHGEYGGTAACVGVGCGAAVKVVG